MNLLCRFCLKEINLDEFNIEIKYCQTFNDNPTRLNIFIDLCKQFSIEVESNLTHKICSACDLALLSTAVFVENCLKANEYFKSQSYKDTSYDLNGDLDLVEDINTSSKINESPLKNGPSIKCNFCCRRFIKTSTLENHRLKFHLNQINEKINFTDTKFTIDEFFSEGFRCHHCQEVYETKQKLRNHIKNHDKLLICSNRFKRQSRLNIHYPSIHSEDSEIKCSECNKFFKSPLSLEYHQNIHRNIKPFYCSSCGESFFSPNSLKKHERLSHNITKTDSKKQQFLCDNCGVSFSRRYHLKRHRIIRHTNPPLAFPCEICGKAFVDQSRLRAHLLIHTDQRDFKCNECNRAFRTQSALQSHTSRVHLNLRPFPCPTCAKAFKSKSHLKKHIRTHTGEKPFSCPICPYISAEHSNLKKHLKIHDRQ